MMRTGQRRQALQSRVHSDPSEHPLGEALGSQVSPASRRPLPHGRSVEVVVELVEVVEVVDVEVVLAEVLEVVLLEVLDVVLLVEVVVGGMPRTSM